MKINTDRTKISKSKVYMQDKFSENKENLLLTSYKKYKIDSEENGTTKVRRRRIMINKYVENQKTPQILKAHSEIVNEDTEKLVRRKSSDIREEKKRDENDKVSTTLSDYDISENSKCKKFQKDSKEKPKLFPDKRLEEFFIKKPKTDPLEDDYFAIDEWHIYEEFLHPLIPSISKNTEVYKNKLIHRHFKNSTTQNFKTDSCKTMEFLLSGKGKRNFIELESFNEQIDSLNNISDQVKFFKKRKVSSCKKVYESVLTFHDSNSRPHCFKVYNDNETGFDNRYNQILKTMEIDNDIETDEEQLYLAKSFTLDNIKDTIESFNSKLLRNKFRFKRSRTTNPARRRRL